MRLVRWTYTDEPVKPVVAKPRLLPDPSLPQSYHVGYALEASEPRPAWLPRQVLDDGRKSYVLLPMNLLVMPAPMVRLVGPNGFELANARQVGSVMVLDHLFNVAELRLGTGKTAETVRIVRQHPAPLPALGMQPARCGRVTPWPPPVSKHRYCTASITSSVTVRTSTSEKCAPVVVSDHFLGKVRGKWRISQKTEVSTGGINCGHRWWLVCT